VKKELQRDEGLLRLARGTRWLAAGALVSAGALSIAVAETLPGRSSAAAPTTTVPSPPPTSSTAPSTQQTDQPTPQTDQPTPQTDPPSTLAPPTSPPQTVYSPPVATSGGS
jgi:hypothetical protein